MKRIDTEMGAYVIYHVSEAGSPSAHDTTNGEWFFEPSDNSNTGEVYSDSYPTEQAAEDAARGWAQAEAAEQAADR